MMWMSPAAGSSSCLTRCVPCPCPSPFLGAFQSDSGREAALLVGMTLVMGQRVTQANIHISEPLFSFWKFGWWGRGGGLNDMAHVCQVSGTTCVL